MPSAIWPKGPSLPPHLWLCFSAQLGKHPRASSQLEVAPGPDPRVERQQGLLGALGIDPQEDNFTELLAVQHKEVTNEDLLGNGAPEKGQREARGRRSNMGFRQLRRQYQISHEV